MLETGRTAGSRTFTNVAKRARNRENAPYLVFKIVQRLSRGWRALNGDPTLIQALLAGVVFKAGVIQLDLHSPADGPVRRR